MTKAKILKIAKYTIYTSLIIVLFFISLEIAQRVHYFFRFRSTYWVFYGFMDKPSNYDEMHSKGLQRKERVIEVPVISYNNYNKYNPAYKTDEYKINSFGFRGKEFEVFKKEGVCRIVALGGSTTFGVDAKDGFTYPEYLERILNSGSYKEYEVINAGVAASTISEINNLFKNEIISLNPDIIVINSLSNNLYYSGRGSSHHRDLLQGINRVLLKRSLFYMTLREKIALLLHGAAGDIYKVSIKDILRNFLEDNSFWDEQKSDFKNIITAARNNGIKVFIVKQPVLLCNKQTRHSVFLDIRMLPVYKRAYELFDEIAQEEKDVEIIEIASYFDSAHNKDGLFTDGLHLTNKGNEYMANLIAKKIIEKP